MVHGSGKWCRRWVHRARHAVLQRVAVRVRRRSALLLAALGLLAIVLPAAVRAGTPGSDPNNGSWVGGLILSPGPEQLVLWNLPGSGGAHGTCIDSHVNGPLHGPYSALRVIHDPVYGELNHLFASGATSDVRLAELSALNSRAYDHVDPSEQWSYLRNGAGGTSVADANAMLAQAQRLAGPYRVALSVPASLPGQYATVTITVQSAAGAPVGGAVVSMSASGGTPTQAAVTTDAAGSATARVLVTGPGATYSVTGAVQSWTDLVEYGAPGEQRMLSAAAPTTQRGTAHATITTDRAVNLIKVAAHDPSHTAVAGYQYRISDAAGHAVATVTTGARPDDAALGRLRIGATYTATEIGTPPGARLYVPVAASMTFTVPAGTGTWTVQAADPEIPAPQLATRASAQQAVVGETLSDAVTISGDDGEDGTVAATRYGPVPPPASGRCADLPLAAYLAAPAVRSTAAVSGTANGGNGTVSVTGPPVTAPGCYGWAETLTLTPSGATASSPPTAPLESTLVTQPALSTVASAQTAAPGTQLIDSVAVSGLGDHAGSVLAVLYGPLPAGTGGCTSVTDRIWQDAVARRGAALVAGTAAFAVRGDGTYRTSPITVSTPGCYTFAERLTPDVTPNRVVAAPLGVAAETTLITAPAHAIPRPPASHAAAAHPAAPPPAAASVAPEQPLAQTGTAAPIGRTLWLAVGLLALGAVAVVVTRGRRE